MDNEKLSILEIREGRFKFRKSGIFKCEYPMWQAMEIGVTALALLYEIFIMGGAGGFLSGGPGSHGIWASLTGSIIEPLACWFFMILGAAAWGFGIAFVRTGEEYSYVADEEKLTIKFPRDKKPQLVIRYDEVTGIECSERHFLWKSLGHDIKVICGKGEFVFRCMHNSASRSNGKRAYPFYIIEERKAAGNEEYKGRYFG